MIERHWGAVYRYLRVLGADPALADDLAQDAFVLALQKSIREQGPGTAAWLRRTARFLLLKSSRRPNDASLEAAEEVWAASQQAGENAYLDALARCRTALTDRARQALDLRYRDALPREDIARALAMTADGVKTVLRRARAALRACIDQRMRT